MTSRTRPTGEQLRFRSQFTGDHSLDTYLEATEKGGRALYDIIADLFDSAGALRSDLYQFREDPMNLGRLQYRLGGDWVDPDDGWNTIIDLSPIQAISGATAFDPALPYVYPEATIGSDGVVYRMLSETPVAGDDPVDSATGNWVSLSAPSIATVAETGSYTDLIDKPNFGSAAFTQATDYLSSAANLADVNDPVSARKHIGLSKITTISSTPSSPVSFDLTQSLNYEVTMTASVTFAFSGLASPDVVGSSGVLIIKQDGVGNHTFNLPAEFKTPVGGSAIAQVKTPNTVSMLSYFVLSSSAVLVNYIGDFQ